RWERRVRLCCYRSLRFQVCGLAVVHCALARRIILFLLSSPCSFLLVLFSCSSVDVFKFNRTLCGYASFSVGLRPHSSLVWDAWLKARPVPWTQISILSKSCAYEFAAGRNRLLLAVKPVDIAVASSYSRRKLEAAFNLLFLHSAQISRSRIATLRLQNLDT